MTLGQKLEEIRCKFNLSQESLAEIINVSRQAITKWESDNGLPDINNLKELSKVFGITVDYLLDTQSNLPALSMRVEIEKELYDNKIDFYKKILDHYYPQPYKNMF